MNTSVKIGGSFSILGIVAATFFASCSASIPTTPPAAREGWRPEIVASAEHEAMVRSMAPFELVDDEGVPIRQDNLKANVRLWVSAKECNGGKHLPNVPQEVGDCSSQGVTNAINYTLAAQIGAGAPQEFHRAFPPYNYGIGRVQMGRGVIKGDGCSCGWVAFGAQKYGVVPIGGDGVPTYSGNVARQWGKTGPPASLIPLGQEHLIKTVSPVRSAAEVRDAVCNGYGVATGSNVGFLMSLPVVEGRLINRASGSWNHVLAIIGYDGETYKEPLFYILNSWGPDAHGTPPDDSPPGGFWVRQADVERIVRQKDSFAFSAVQGFPATLDFRIFGQKPKEPVRLELLPTPAKKTSWNQKRNISHSFSQSV